MHKNSKWSVKSFSGEILPMNHHPRGEIVWVCYNSSCFYAVYHVSSSYLDQPPEKTTWKGRNRESEWNICETKCWENSEYNPVEDWRHHMTYNLYLVPFQSIWRNNHQTTTLSPTVLQVENALANYVQRAKAMEASIPCWRVQTSQRFMLYSTPTQSCRVTVVEDPPNQQAFRVRGDKIYWLVHQKSI